MTLYHLDADYVDSLSETSKFCAIPHSCIYLGVSWIYYYAGGCVASLMEGAFLMPGAI